MSVDQFEQSAEHVAGITYTALERYLEENMDAEAYKEYIDQRQILFPTWQHIWQKIEPWLRNHTFHNMQDTILDLAGCIPNMQAVQSQLVNALSLHEDFWNQVYQNLAIAKSRLP
ncbi:hypothetical protein JTE90_022617 [Oedothorax gibbosus]|uniref:Uncharacterized protein n=1 Tax=Oedothorax gibbosus TaxID=931172 RepID=A0AAV6TUN6_9ARAC|nr:hypothetical protein JTE90_022617 [Oedothorax gibbosus]